MNEIIGSWQNTLKREELYPCEKLNDSCIVLNKRTFIIKNGKKPFFAYYSGYYKGSEASQKEAFLKQKPKGAVYLEKITEGQLEILSLSEEKNIYRLKITFWLGDQCTQFKESNNEIEPIPSQKQSWEKKTWVFEFVTKKLLQDERHGHFVNVKPSPEEKEKKLKSTGQISNPQQQDQSNNSSNLQSNQIIANNSRNAGNIVPNNIRDQEIDQNQHDQSDLNPPSLDNSTYLQNQKNWEEEYFQAFTQQNNKKELEKFLQSFYEFCAQLIKNNQSNQQIRRHIYKDEFQDIHYSNQILFEILFKWQKQQRKPILPPLTCFVYHGNMKYFCDLHVEPNVNTDEYVQHQISDLIKENPQLNFLVGSSIRVKDVNTYYVLKILDINNFDRFPKEVNLQQLISDLDRMEMNVQLNQISTIFHKRGIKMVKLGQVAKDSKNKFIKQVCIIQMIARTEKRLSRLDTNQDYERQIKQILKNHFHREKQKNELETLFGQIEIKFDYKIDDSISIPQILLLNCLMHHLNFQIDIKIQELLDQNINLEQSNLYDYIIENSLIIKSRGKFYFQSNDEQVERNYYDLVQQKEKQFNQTKSLSDAQKAEQMISLVYGTSAIQLGQFKLNVAQQIDAGAKNRLHEALEIFENNLPPNHNLFGFVFYQISKIFEKDGNQHQQEEYLKKSINFLENDHNKELIRFEYSKLANQNQHYEDAYQSLCNIKTQTDEMVEQGFELEKQLKRVDKFTNLVFEQKLESQFADILSFLSYSFAILKEKEEIRTKTYLDKLKYCIEKFTTKSESVETLIHFIKYQKIKDPSSLFKFFVANFNKHQNLLEFNLGLYRNFKKIINHLDDGSEFWRILELYLMIVGYGY